MYALADICVKIIPTDCFHGERLLSQHRQRFFGFGRRKFPIEIREIFFSQFDIDRPRVVADVLFAARFWNRYRSRLTQHPRERDLRRGSVMTFGDLPERRVLGKPRP